MNIFDICCYVISAKQVQGGLEDQGGLVDDRLILPEPIDGGQKDDVVVEFLPSTTWHGGQEYFPGQKVISRFKQNYFMMNMFVLRSHMRCLCNM